MLPFTVVSSTLFARTEDRRALALLSLLSAGCSALVCRLPGTQYSVAQYVAASALLFGCLNAVEGTVMSLLARLVPPALANSTFNSGLATSVL